MLPKTSLAKPEVSTLQKTGSFYFALTHFCTGADNRIWTTYNAGTLNDESLSGIGFRTSANGPRTLEPRLGSVRFSPKRSPAGYSQSVSLSVTAHLVDGA
jgi:hypothetical protein